MATRAKKTVDEQIAAAELAIKKHEAKLKELKAKKDGGGKLTAESRGMAELLAAVDKVSTENDCNKIAVVQAITRLKRLPLTITQKPKAPRGSGTAVKKSKGNSPKTS